MYRILIVEDNAENRELMAEILRETAKCEFAETGKTGVNAYNQALKNNEPFDLILLDLELPEVSGLEILANIRKSEEKAGIHLGDGVPVIVVTGHERRFLEAYNRGCDDYILKPIDADRLISKITTILSKRHPR